MTIATTKLSEIMVQVEGHKINTQNSIVFAYSIHEESESKNRKTIPSTIPSKRRNYSGINLKCKNGKLKTTKISLKENKNVNEGKNICAHELEHLILSRW